MIEISKKHKITPYEKIVISRYLLSFPDPQSIQPGPAKFERIAPPATQK